MSANDRCYVGVPKWVWHFAVLGALGALVMATAGWVGTELEAARRDNADQDVAIGTVTQRVDSHDKAIDRIDNKLDRILERLK